MAETKMSHFYIMASLSIFLLGVINSTNPNLEEPFWFPFGPDHGDSFSTKIDDACTAKQSFSNGYTFKYGSNDQDSLFVCTNGYMSFGSTFTSFQPSGLDTVTLPLILPMYSDVDTADEFYDFMCDPSHYALYYTYFEIACTNRLDVATSFSIDFNFNEDIVDPTIRAKTIAWEQRTFSTANFDVYYDDYLARLVFGVQTTKYVNLANNIFKREMSASDKLLAENLIQVKFAKFAAEWGFVATWYKVGRFSERIDAFNSYQAAIMCGLISAIKKCFVMYDYFQMEWGWSSAQGALAARAGFADGEGFVLELPFSGTIEVRNLWAYSNFDQDSHPGVWLFELNQNATNDQPPVFPVGSLYFGGLDLKTICNGPLEPTIALVYDSVGFSISNCVLPPHGKTQIRIKGSILDSAFDATYDQNNQLLQTNETIRWTETEAVAIFVYLDEVTIPGHFTAYFVNPQSLNGVNPIGVEVNANFTRFVLNFAECGSGFGSLIVTMIERLSDRSNGETFIKRHQVDIPPDSVIVTYEIEEEANGGTIQFSTTDGLCYSIEIESLQKSAEGPGIDFCSLWFEEEANNSYDACERDLKRWYGCPRHVIDIDGEERNDSFWAEREVDVGMNGWEYDICCNPHDKETREKLNLVHYCEAHVCTYNEGADFCIRSPRLACRASIAGEQRSIMVSNQCCYAGGALIDEKHATWQYVAGRMHRELNSMDNLPGHYWNDLYPFYRCCLQKRPYSPECVSDFKSKRKTLIGSYLPRNIRINRGDPDIATIDGRTYPFMGLGVFTMLTTSQNNPTVFQASMRRLGNGTVFSGLAIKYGNIVLECHINEDANFTLAIEGHVRQLGLLREYVLSDIEIHESTDAKTFKFHFLANNLIVMVQVVNNFLNLLISVPPTFWNQTEGLMGNYNGNASDDFQAPDGTILDPDTDLLTLHHQFGNSWKLDRSDWVFSVESIIDDIEEEIFLGSPFTPIYDIVFESPEQEADAIQFCKNDTACMRDVSLTGNVSIADAFVVLQDQIEAAIVTNQISLIANQIFLDDLLNISNEFSVSTQSGDIDEVSTREHFTRFFSTMASPVETTLEANGGSASEDAAKTNTWLLLTIVGSGSVFIICLIALARHCHSKVTNVPRRGGIKSKNQVNPEQPYVWTTKGAGSWDWYY